ncbi:hypothetical protein [Arsenicicoccus sp. oral taxon 190]|uniref:hypothetical protein n=1 Tax=Arsenicicoccus sp. oral taxon 190 TaxID=1658671 RepID=UPI000679FF1F|nr:hypothetical protein [Arsenicicoccus sp. oral taxon 190]AKT50123.1 hypothetical protein ADJ73_00070 [Arsenicicoccus sp. oral taxon 190]
MTDRPHGSTSRRDPRPALRRLRWPALVGVLVAAVVGLLLLQRPTTYTSTIDVVVVPAKAASATDSAALFDTLSRGQVIATAAEMYAQPRWNPQAGRVEVTAGNIAPSAVVKVTAAGTDAAAVRSTLDQVVDTATPEITKVLAPYTVQVLQQQPSAPTGKGFSLPLKVLLALLAGLLAGILAEAAARALARRRAG